MELEKHGFLFVCDFVSCSAPWAIVLSASFWLGKVVVSVALGHYSCDLPSDSYVSECVKRWDVSVFLWELTICYPLSLEKIEILELSVPMSI